MHVARDAKHPVALAPFAATAGLKRALRPKPPLRMKAFTAVPIVFPHSSFPAFRNIVTPPRVRRGGQTTLFPLPWAALARKNAPPFRRTGNFAPRGLMDGPGKRRRRKEDAPDGAFPGARQAKESAPTLSGIPAIGRGSSKTGLGRGSALRRKVSNLVEDRWIRVIFHPGTLAIRG
jgi:hypothetical protein